MCYFIIITKIYIYIFVLYENLEGKSLNEIASALGTKKSTIQDWLK
jgi:transposase